MALPPITRAQLENAARDADDLGLIVNGVPAQSPVNTRFGGPVKTVSKLIEEAETDLTGAIAQAQAAAEEAEDWAEKTDGPVEPGKYSAKYWAEQTSVKNWIVRTFGGDGVQTTFNLGVDPGSASNCFVVVDGVQQQLDAYSISGTNIIFSEPPPALESGETYNIECRVGEAGDVTVVGDGTVTNPKIGNDAVNARTINAADAPAIRTKLGLNNISSVTPRQFAGFSIINTAADTVNDITVFPGACANDDDAAPVLMTLSASITKRLDAVWAAGNNNGGLDTGTVANNTTYHLWLIRNPTTQVVDVLFSVSATTPTMPTGFTQKRYLWPVVRGAASLNQFIQRGNYFMLVAPVATTSVGIATTAALLTLPGIPLGVNVMADFTANIFVNGANLHAYFSSPLANDNTPAPGTYSSLATPSSAAYAAGQFSILTNTAGQIRHRASAAISNFTALPVGYRFERN